MLFSPHGIAMPKGLYFTAVVSSSFFSFISRTNFWGHWTDLNLTWTHIHLWRLFEKFGPISPGYLPPRAGAKKRFWDRFWTFTEHISAKERDITLQGLPYMSPNLVNYDQENAENGWRVFAHPLNFLHWETLPALPHGCYITDSRQTLARVMLWHELAV